ncbi:prepilin-type N-terminal cleavage/methylation domain-containing protein, partial [bacterium]|nr:prepilin-type N-terminal cleavage/methylation domain-containing protein [bacterium]
LHRRQIFDWKHHALVLISYVKNLRNRRSLLVPLRGFTLAEVLITLGIIGVVAALTIPTLMQKTNDKEIISSVKKMYSTLSNAIQLSTAENGTVDKWTFDPGVNAQSATEFWEYIKDYFKIAEDCGTEGTGCYTEDGSIYTVGKGPNVKTNSYVTQTGYYFVSLVDGSTFWFRTNGESCNASDGEVQNVCAIVWYDVNGKKSPNRLGKDIFLFHILKDKVLPNTRDDCKQGDNGWGCASYVIKNENLNYLKDINY